MSDFRHNARFLLVVIVDIIRDYFTPAMPGEYN